MSNLPLVMCLTRHKDVPGEKDLHDKIEKLRGLLAEVAGSGDPDLVLRLSRALDRLIVRYTKMKAGKKP